MRTIRCTSRHRVRRNRRGGPGRDPGRWVTGLRGVRTDNSPDRSTWMHRSSGPRDRRSSNARSGGGHIAQASVAVDASGDGEMTSTARVGGPSMPRGLTRPACSRATKMMSGWTIVVWLRSSRAGCVEAARLARRSEQSVAKDVEEMAFTRWCHVPGDGVTDSRVVHPTDDRHREGPVVLVGERGAAHRLETPPKKSRSGRESATAGGEGTTAKQGGTSPQMVNASKQIRCDHEPVPPDRHMSHRAARWTLGSAS